MATMSEHNLISESQARELIEEELKKIGPNLIEKVSQKLTDTFTKKELNKTLESIKESVVQNNLQVSELVTNFISKSSDEIASTNAEYKEHTKSFISEIKPLFMQSLDREIASIKSKQLELDQARQRLLDRENELNTKEANIKFSHSQFEQESELFQNEKQAFTEKESELSEREEKLEKNWRVFKKKYEELQQKESEVSELAKTASEKKQAATEFLSKLVPPFISNNENLASFFERISKGGSFDGTATLLVAQLNMLNCYLQSGDLRNLNNCLKEIGRAIFSYCYENDLDRSDIPEVLAEVINNNETIQSNGVVIQVPCEGAPIESTWMYDDSTTRGNSISRILTWGLRDMQNGSAIAKAEIES